MQYTTNFSLRKPQLLEPASVADLNANADSIDTLLYQNRHISATDYNQNTSYAVGDLVIYENLFYKCTGTTSGNWDSSKWVRTTLAAEVELAGQSGGSVVEGNPSGTATAQLEKIGIDNDIFFINDASKIIADPYDSTSTYAVGDYCIYNTLLYKCTTAVSTAEAFDSNKWTACLVTDEMGSGGGGSAELNEVTKAQYDALTEAQKKNGEMYFIKDVNGDGSQFQPVIYSTEKREIGVWTDGRPVYQQTFASPTIGRGSYGDITISNLDSVISVSGISGEGTPIPYLDTGGNSGFVGWYKLTDGVRITTGSNRSISAGKVTILFTLTTDTPGSGTWTPQGVPAHHYSTSEQVVGTWVDNKPLYEKTVYFVNTRSSFSDFVSVEQIPNIDTTVCIEFTCVRDLGAQFGYLQITGSGSTKPEALSANYGIAFRTNGDYLQYRIDGYGTQVTDCYVTICYTKTTD